MVDLCISSDGAEAIFGIDEAYRLIKEAGFQAVDVGFFSSIVTPADVKSQKVDSKWLEPGDHFDKELFRPYKNAAEKYGLDHFQCHSLFPSLVTNANNEFNQGLIEAHKKMIAACDYIGCRLIVIHPFEYEYAFGADSEKLWDLNISNYMQLVDTAKKHNVTILLENMVIKHNDKRYEGACSDLSEACNYVDTLNRMAGSEVFGFCLDTGHLNLLGKDPKKWLVRLGGRVKALHINDNNGNSDQHIAPYTGTIDWKCFIEGLRDSGYHSTLNFETVNIWKRMVPGVAVEMMKVIAETGRFFIRESGL